VSTLILTDIFDRANGAPGNSWTDVDGSVWSISSQVLTATNASTLNLNGRWLLRPTSEVSGNADEAGVLYFRATNTGAGGPNTSYAIVLRGTAGSGNSGYVAQIDVVGGSVAIYKFVNGTRTTVQGPLGWTPTAGLTGYVAWFGAKTNGANVDLKFVIYRATDVSTPLLTITKTAVTSPIASGQVGLRGDYTHTDTRWQTWSYDGTAPTLIADAVQATTPTLGAVTSSSVALSIATAISGGTAPYSSQLHRSTDPSFTPGVGTAIGSPVTGTTPSFTDSTVSSNTLYWYKVVVTDSTSGTALTATTTATGARTYLADAPLRVGCIGDSTKANRPHNSGGDMGTADTTNGALIGDANLSKYNAWDMTVHALRIIAGGGRGLRQVTDTNQAQGGTTTIDYKPAVSGLAQSAYLLSPADATGTNANVGTGLLRTAIRALYGIAGTHCLVRLGINDSNPAATNMSVATWQQNMTDICNALIGNGITPVVEDVPFFPPGADGIWTEAGVKRAQDYNAAIPTVLAGAVGAKRGIALHLTVDYPLAMMGSASATPNLGVHHDQDGAWMDGVGSAWGLANAMGVAGSSVFVMRRRVVVSRPVRLPGRVVPLPALPPQQVPILLPARTRQYPRAAYPVRQRQPLPVQGVVPPAVQSVVITSPRIVR
jgi:hypothetical protein